MAPKSKPRAYKVLGYPHLSMALEIGGIYTRAELESRCSGTSERKRQLEKKLEDPKLFKPVPLAGCFAKKRKAASTNGQPQWVRPPKVAGNRKIDENASTRQRIAERLADQLLRESNGKVTDDMLLAVLQAWGSYDNKRRKNVRRKDAKAVFSDTFGLVTSRGGSKPVLTGMSRKCPQVTRMMTLWLKGQNPKFPATSISLNVNYRAARHRDRFNAGPSAIRAIGRFKGGQLLYWKRDPRNCKVKKLKRKDSTKLDLRERLHYFDGTRAHEVCAFKGMRFSIVYFTVQNYFKTPAKLRRQCEDLGFHMPTEKSLEKAKKMAQ